MCGAHRVECLVGANSVAVTFWLTVDSFGLGGKSQLIPGQTVLVQGTGGVSVAATQIALAIGCRVIMTSSSDDKLAHLKTVFANGHVSGEFHTLNYKTYPNWGDQVMNMTNGQGADHVLEVGGAATVTESFKALRFGGTITS